jgi:hypothetical protein
MIMEVDIDFSVSWALIIEALLAVILPLVVGLVTTRATPSAAKAMLLAGLNILSTGLTDLLFAINTDAEFDLGNWLVAAITSFATSAATYYGLWKPTGVAPALQRVGSKDSAPENPREG